MCFQNTLQQKARILYKHVNYLMWLMGVFLPFASAAAEDVRISVRPQPAYIEQSASAQLLNFDFAVENLTSDTLELAEIKLSAFDHTGHLVARKFLDGNGTRPNILTIPNRVLTAQSALLIFNPFYTFAPDMELSRLKYEFLFGSATSAEKEYRAEITVTPTVYQTKTKLILPIQGRSIIYDGHDFYAHHRRFDFLNPFLQQFGFNSNFMRYSYDFCAVNEQGDMSKDSEAVNENWYGFGLPIRAAAAGTIAAVIDTMPDSRRFNEAEIPQRPMVIFGNYIVIDHQNGEYSLYAHVKQGSIRVKVGEVVKSGQMIGQVGASGSANIPHLHYELRTGIDTKAEGLPSYFYDFSRVLGEKMVKVSRGQVDTGDILETK